MQRWKINLYILMVGNFLVMAGMTMIMPFLSLYLQQDLGLTDEHEIGVWAGIIFAANFVASFLFQPLWGKLAEKYGRKMMLLRSGFGMSIVMLLMGFATAPWHLLILRMLNGVISGFMPAAVSLVVYDAEGANGIRHGHTAIRRYRGGDSRPFYRRVNGGQLRISSDLLHNRNFIISRICHHLAARSREV